VSGEPLACLGGRDQCWWKSPAGAEGCGTGQVSAVGEKTDGGGYFRNFCLPPLGGWIVPFSGGQSLMLPY